MKWMQENTSLADIPVMFLTSYQDINFEVRAFELGAVDYIHKPFSPILLKKRIALHLEHAANTARLASYNSILQSALDEKTHIIKELQYAIVFTLSDLVEMRDRSTGGHIQRTTAYYRLILQHLEKSGIYPQYLKGLDYEIVCEAAQLHDIGKVAIPDCILLKNGRLEESEFAVMKTHTLIGHNALVKAMMLTHDKDFLNLAAIVALTHHERWDGTGYPYGISAEAIPFVGRVMAIVDVYDAIVSERPYKKAFPHSYAIQEIANGRGTHFDPVLVDAVLEIGDEFLKVANSD